MKKSLIIAILYLSFLSLGLPDQLLGVAWPEMRRGLGQSLDKAGLLVTISTLCGAIAGYSSGYLTKRFSTSVIISISTFMTIVGILGYATSNNWCFVMLISIPFGLGGGAIDSIFNNYAAKHLGSKHVNWLHGFWGVGATLGPMILTIVYSLNYNWKVALYIVAFAQLLLMSVFIITKNIWEKPIKIKEDTSFKTSIISINTFLSAFFFAIYTGLEASAGLWYYSYMVDYKHLSAVYAGSIITLFWVVYTSGRFLIGYITKWFNDKTIITASIILSLISFVLLYFDIYFAIAITGLAFAGIYPCMITESYKRFSPNVAETLIGHQVGATYLGVAIITPLIGYICQKVGLNFLIPIFAILGLCLFLIDIKLRKLSK